jgi:prepilin-type N-terminal cleavage/methylation domain-containing protein
LKRAFTLIELLVVIAIIAILAAILFPVFAQAKLAAKKTVAISNQKQLGLAILMYANDYDDMYPRQDGCTMNDSIVTKFNTSPASATPYCNGIGDGTGSGGWAFRDNHYSWQKWVMPYVKSAPMFFDPVVQPLAGAAYNATTNSGGPNGLFAGEVEGGYALNTAITGALSTWPTTALYGIRNSWLGGSTTSVPDPSDAMLIMEQAGNSVLPAYEYGTTTNKYSLTYYPAAIKEHWIGYFYNTGSTDANSNCYATLPLTPDNASAPYTGSVPLSYTDGHTKSIPLGQFIANTPTAAQYGLTYNKYVCSLSAATIYGNGQPNTNINFPMWGLTGS